MIPSSTLQPTIIQDRPDLAPPATDAQIVQRSARRQRRIRSSSPVGSPRPSRLDVRIHSEPSGASCDRAQPAVPARQQGPRRAGAGRPSSGTCQSRSPRSAATYRVEPAIVDPAGGGVRGRPGDQRRGEARVVRGALHGRPAVVLAGLDEVDLVEPVLPELAGPQPAGAGRRPAPARCGARTTRPASRRTGCPGPAGRPGSSAGSCRRARSGPGTGRGGGVAGAGVEVAVRAEGEPAAVVDARARDAGDDRLRRLRRAAAGRSGCPRRSSSRRRPAGPARTPGRPRCRAGRPRRHRPLRTAAGPRSGAAAGRARAGSGPSPAR